MVYFQTFLILDDHIYVGPKLKFYKDPLNPQVEVITLSYECVKVQKLSFSILFAQILKYPL